MTNNFQRVGNKSNAAVGKEFEEKVYQLFLEKGIQLEKQVKVDIGINAKKPMLLTLEMMTTLLNVSPIPGLKQEKHQTEKSKTG